MSANSPSNDLLRSVSARNVGEKNVYKDVVENLHDGSLPVRFVGPIHVQGRSPYVRAIHPSAVLVLMR